MQRTRGWRWCHRPAPARRACSSSTTIRRSASSARPGSASMGTKSSKLRTVSAHSSSRSPTTPAVVLLDLSIPVLDGFGVAAALRDRRPNPRRAGRSPHRRDRRHTSSNGCTSSAWPGCSSKPFHPSAVAEFVRNVIGGVAAEEGPAARRARVLAEEQQQRVGRRVVVREHRHVGSRDGRVDAVANRVG